MQLLVRTGAFRGDEERLRRGLALLAHSELLTARYMSLYARVMLGEREAIVGVSEALKVLEGSVSDRFRCLVHQLNAEAWGRLGDAERSLEHVRAAAETGVLLDLEWMDRCPLLEGARGSAGFAELRKKVRARCEAIWSS